jgi:hypothetical protein
MGFVCNKSSLLEESILILCTTIFNIYKGWRGGIRRSGRRQPRGLVKGCSAIQYTCDIIFHKEGRITLTQIIKERGGKQDWINHAQDRDLQWERLTMIMNFPGSVEDIKFF